MKQRLLSKKISVEGAKQDDEPPSEESVEHAQYIKERIEELESQYSMIWRIRIQLDKGQRTSREDLKYINKVNKELF